MADKKRLWVPLDESQGQQAGGTSSSDGQPQGQSDYDAFIAANRMPDAPTKVQAPQQQRMSLADSLRSSVDATLGKVADLSQAAADVVTGKFGDQPSALEQLPTSAPKAPVSPVDAKTFEAAKAELGAMPRDQRLKLADLPGWRGQVARAAIKQLDDEQAGTNRLQMGDVSPTVEGRAAHYAAQGASPEVAQSMALSDMQAGARSGNVHFAADGGATAEQDAAARGEAQGLQGRSLGVRAGYAAYEGMKSGAMGVASAALRAAGDEDTAKALELGARRAKLKINTVNELTALRQRAQQDGTVYGNDAFWEGQAVSGLASAAQNVPQIGAGIALAAITKNPAAGARLSMSLMTSQAFGDSYIDGRLAGMTPGAAAGRAGIMAAFEYLGERYGLIPAAMKAAGGKASSVPLEELPAWLERYVGALEKRGVLSPTAANVAREQLGEQVGEQLTTLGQYWVDGTPMGINQPVSLSGYLEAARDTAIQTLIATGALQGAGHGVQSVAGGGQAHGAMQPEQGGQPDQPDQPGIAGQDGQQGGQAQVADAGAGAGTMAGTESALPQQATAAAAQAPNQQVQAQPQPSGEDAAITGLAEDVSTPAPAPTPAQADQQAPQAQQEAQPAQQPADDAQQQTGAVNADGGGQAVGAGSTPIDEGAHQAATSPSNDLPEPSQAQKDAGNYKKGHVKLHGLDVTIENPRGSTRSGVSPEGVPWETTMQHHYGYVRGTVGADKDHVDTFIGANPESTRVFVVDQVDPKTGEFDEHKVVMGADSPEQAREIYLSNYEPGWKGMAAITELPMDAFKSWVRDGAKRKPLGDISAATANIQRNDEQNAPQAPEPAATPQATQEAADQGRDRAPEAGSQQDGSAGAGRSDATQEDGVGAKFKPVTEFTGVNVGPAGMIRPQAVAPGRHTYRETGVEGLGQMMREDRTAVPFNGFVADSPDIAIGQYNNRGVHVVFRPDSVSGHEHSKPMTGDQAGREYRTNLLAPHAVQTITMDAKDLPKLSKLTQMRLKQEFDREDISGDRMRFHRKGLDRLSPPDPVGYAAPKEKAKPLSTALDPEQDTMLQALAKLGGIRRSIVAKEFGLKDEEQKHTVMAGRLKAYPFRKTGGMTLDQALSALGEAGYFDGVPEDMHRATFEQAIYDEMGGSPRLTSLGQMRRAQGAYNDHQDQLAQHDAQLDPEAQAERDAIMAEAGISEDEMSSLSDDDVAFEAQDQPTAAHLLASMRSMGFSEKEIADEIQARSLAQGRGQEAAQSPGRQAPAPDGAGGTEARGDGRTESGTAPADSHAGQEEGLTLKSQSEQDLRDKVSREEAAKAAQAKAKAAEQKQLQQADAAREDRARADATVDDFQLGQSADQQMSGMDDMFSSSAPGKSAEPSSGESIQDVGEKIGGARKDTATKTGPKARVAPSDDRPGWMKRYAAVQSVKDAGQGKTVWHLLDKRTEKAVRGSDWRPMAFDSAAEAEAAIPLVEVARNHRVTNASEVDPATGERPYVIMRDVSDRKRVQVVPQSFATREEAMRYMQEHAAQIIETKTSFGEEILDKPDTVVRTGQDRRRGDAKGEDFLRDFGLRGVEFGNWNNQEERQQVMNHAYDALSDLAGVLNLPPRALGLGGELGLAFGARGHGLSGARAHYESDYGVINLTKMSGAGSLAHEWFHALDHYLARQDGKASREREPNKRGDLTFNASSPSMDLASHGFKLRGSEVREELRQAYDTLIKAMFSKAEQYVHDANAQEKFVGQTKSDLAKELQSLRDYLARELDTKYHKRNFKPASAEHLATFDGIAERLIAGEALDTELRAGGSARSMSGMRWTNDALDQISTILKAVRGTNGFKSDRSGTLDSLRGYMSRYAQRLKMLADAQAGEQQQRMTATQYAMDAKAIDQGRASDYWTTEHEMAARAFEAYVQDKIEAAGGKSDFLVYGTKGMLVTPWGWVRAYPAGEERQALASAFDKFIGEIKTREDESGHVALFSIAGIGEGVDVASLNARKLERAISRDDLTEVVGRNIDAWKGIGVDRVVAVERGEDLPADLLDSAERNGFHVEDIEGVVFRNRVYLVRANLHDRVHAERVLFHEAFGHMGVRAALAGQPTQTLNALWDKLNGLAGVARLAKRIDVGGGRTAWDRLQPYVRAAQRDQTDRRTQIIDELLAFMAQANDTGAMTQFKGYLADLKAAMVRLMRRLGLDRLADTIDRRGAELEVLQLVRDARRAIEQGRTRDGRVFAFVAQPAPVAAYSQANDEQQAYSMRDDQPVDVPDAIVAHPLNVATQHADYAAAKAGDVLAATRLAIDLVTPDLVARVRQQFGTDVIVQPVVAEEAGGRNKIPLSTAEVLARELGASSGTDVMQSSRSHRTAMDGLDRLFASPEFSGDVVRGGRYLLVDDTLTQGGTFAALASHIRAGGGEVVGALALTGKQYSAKLRLSPELLSQVRERYANVEDAFRAATGRGFDSLTQSEARYLAKHNAPDTVRDRISEAGRKASQRTGEADPGQSQGELNQRAAEDGGDGAQFSLREEAGQPGAEQPEDPLQSARRKAGIRPQHGVIRRTVDAVADKLRGALAMLSDRNAAAERLQQEVLDQFTGIKSAVEREVGNLPVEQDPYIAARLANGGTSSVMRGLLMHGQAKWSDNGQHLVKVDGTQGLLDILKPLGDDLDNWFTWMIGNRAARLMGEGRENNFTSAEIAAMQALGSGDKKALFTKVALQYADFKRSVLDIAQDAGLLDPVARKAWDHADYIPFYRQIDDKAAFSPTGRKGLAGQSSGIRTLRGGTSGLNDPMENVLMNFSRLIDASLKNNAIRKTIDTLGTKSGVVQKVGYDMAGAMVPRAQIEKMLLDSGVPADMVSIFPPGVFEGMAKMWSIKPPADPDVVRIMRGGKPEFYRVADPLLLKSLASFVPFDVPGLSVARWFKRTLTHAVTSTPEFMLRNFIRDSLATQMITRDKFNPASALVGIRDSYLGTGASEAMLFAGASFQSGNVDAADPTATGRAMRRALRARGLDASSADAFMGTVVDKGLRGWEHYREVGEAIENANREAAYKAAIEAGRSGTAAAYEAKDLMDFSLRGSSPLYQIAADTLPFLNARVQGLYRLGRSDPKRLLAYGMLMMVASLALAGANGGEDWYEELPDWDKDTYWHIRLAGQHFRIPKPFELGVVFATLPERLMRFMQGLDRGSKTVGRVWSNVRDQLAFDVVPQAARPVLNVWANKDTFRDAPIEGMTDEGKLPHMRYSATTSATAKAVTGLAPGVSDAIGLSPKRLEYLVNGYFGTIGSYALGLSDMAIRAASGEPAGPSWRADDLPVVKSFYRVDPARSTVYESDLFNMRNELDQLYRSVNALQREGRTDDAAQMAEANVDNLRARRLLDTAAKGLSFMSRQRDKIMRDTDMSPEDKRAALDALQQRRNDLARRVMTSDAVNAATP